MILSDDRVCKKDGSMEREKKERSFFHVVFAKNANNPGNAGLLSKDLLSACKPVSELP